MIYEFNIKVPLTYNKFAILSNNPDTEHCYVFEGCYEEIFEEVFKTYEIPEYSDGYEFKNTIKITLQENIVDNAKNLQMKEAPRLICEINGLLVDDDKVAKVFAENIVNKICKRLSLIFIKYNHNRHLSQPRVEPVWREASYDYNKYNPFIEMKYKTKGNFEGDNNIIYLDDYLSLRVGIYCVTRTTIPSHEIRLGEWLKNLDDDLEFLVNEYYSALGTENIKSKFFHLFSMIEFCEMKYRKYNGSCRLLSDEEVDAIIAGVENYVDKNNKEKVLSILKSNLLKASDIGRARKLENILKWMGVEKVKQNGIEKMIDKELLDKLIELRNKSFHGTKEKTDDAIKRYATAVESLLYINEMILEFMMQNDTKEKTKSIYITEGKH